MKTPPSFIAVCALAGCTLLASCSKSDHTPPKGVAGVTPQGRMEMEFKWIVGKQYQMRMDLISASEADLPNQKQPMKQDTKMSQDYTISVLKELPDGGKELQLEFTGATMESKMGDRVVLSFDSTQDPARDAGNPVAPMLRRMVGGQLKYVLNADSRVEKVEGGRELSARIMQGLPAQLQAGFGGMYNDGNYKQLCDLARLAPGRGAKPGSTWSLDREEEMESLGILVIKAKLKFEDWEQHGTRKCARIESVGDMTSKPTEAAAGAAPAISIAIEQGKVVSTGWFDPELGMVVDSVSDQDLTMKITTGGQTITSRAKQKINIKLLAVTDAAK